MSVPTRPFLLTDEEADVVVALMRQCFEEYVAKYREDKYPPAIYEDLRRAFELPSQVADANVRTAVLWKFGHLRKKRIPDRHEELIASLQREWPALCSTLTGPAEAVFTSLKRAIGGRDRFITTAFFLHLLRPSEIPIIDQHNFRAMNYFCRTVRPAWRLKSKPNTYRDVATLASFLSEVRSRWAAIDPSMVPDEGKLDRFLMMYGKGLKAPKRPRPQVPPKAPPCGQAETRSFNDSGTRISLPFGGTNRYFDANDLVRYLIESGRNHIIQGQTNCRLSAHPKPSSLDVWLRRTFADNPDTTQAVNEVVRQLKSTGLFEEGKFFCPDSRRTCKGIRLVPAGKV